MNANLSNPWILMWLHPRQTMRQIIDTDPNRNVVLLAAVSGIGETLSNAAFNSKGDHASLMIIFLTSVTAGPIVGIISLYIIGEFLLCTGKWIGGLAEANEIRSAFAWSGVIGIWAMILWVPEILLFGKELFTTETPQIDASTALTTFFWLFAVIELSIIIWGFVAFLKCLSEVQGFSFCKAVLNTLLPMSVLVPLFIIIGW